MTANKYLAAGFVVFPVGLTYNEEKSSNGKVKKDVAPEPGFTKLTLQAAKRLSFTKNAIGLLTGFGVMALDIDNTQLWDHILSELGESEPETCRCIILFKVTPELERLRKHSVFGLKKLGRNNFDVLGKGDFLLVPPSSFMTPLEQRQCTFVEGYSLVDNPEKLIEAPEWLLQVLTPGSVPHNRVRGSYLRQDLAEKAKKRKEEERAEKDRKAKQEDQQGQEEQDHGGDDLTENERALLDLDLVERLKEVAKHVKKLRAVRAVDRQSWIETGDGTLGRVLPSRWALQSSDLGVPVGLVQKWLRDHHRLLDPLGQEDAREEKKRLKAEEEKEEKKLKADKALRREVVKFGVDHTGGKGVFKGWNAEKSVAVIRNTMHHPDHRVECVFNSDGAFQQCLECAWRNPFAGELAVPARKYPALHQQFYNIIINNTVNNYNNNSNDSAELELWDDEAHLADDYQPFDDPDLSLLFKRAFSGIDSNFGAVVARLYEGRVVSSGEDNTIWFKLEDEGFRWFPADLGDIKELLNPQAGGKLLHNKLCEAWQHYLANGNKKLAAQIIRVRNKVQEEAFMTRVTKQTCARLLKRGYKELVKNLDKNKNLLAFDNGVYDLDKGEFREGKAEDYISKSVGYDFVPGCKDHRAELDDFFAKLFPDDELRDYVLRYLASCLSGNTRDQMTFFRYGSGQNGKSKLLALMKETLGPDYASTTDKGVVIGQQRPHANAVTHALNMLKGKRFVYISETVEGSKINKSAFKALSGEDCVFSRELYKQGQEIKPEFKLFMVCNHLPKFNAADEAMVRRIAVIPFQSQFVYPEEMNGRPNVFPIDTSLDDAKMKSWRSAFMSMLLKWYPKYQRRGIADKPALVKAMTSGYLSENNPVKAFLQMACETVAVEDSAY
ncbi:hypothetical protein HK102_005911 [Quaeritorhiza haematococci]|nr:hypothetical protein HK102_005911 [Quaeritorhiza haematococci]